MTTINTWTNVPYADPVVKQLTLLIFMLRSAKGSLEFDMNSDSEGATPFTVGSIVAYDFAIRLTERRLADYLASMVVQL